MSVQETTYFSEAGVHVSNARVVLGNKTYAMANITSVSVGVLPANNKPVYGLMAVGALIALCSVGRMETIGGVILGIVLIGLGIFILSQAKPKFAVRLGSASGESDGLVSPNREHIDQIVSAINNAIVRRG